MKGRGSALQRAQRLQYLPIGPAVGAEIGAPAAMIVVGQVSGSRQGRSFASPGRD